MKKSILVLLSFLILIVGCTHYSSISSSEVFADKYKYVTKVDLNNNNTILIKNTDCNKVILSDSILVAQVDSTLVNIKSEEVKQFYENEFSISRTLWLTGGILSMAWLLFLKYYSVQ
ncbi:MAG: hypothetical protein H6610_11365 [Ignavibacteriales bacterium]|nr:hypothetical protein [Ignavibacteriales bacterium]